MENIDKVRSIISKEFINQMPGYLGVVGPDSKFILVNNEGTQWIGYKSPDDLIGKTYYDARCKLAEEAEAVVQQDARVLAQGRIKFLAYACYADDAWKVVMGEKYVLRDSQKNVLGIVCSCKDISSSRAVDVSRVLMREDVRFRDRKDKKKFAYMLESDKQECDLSDKQLECLYFLIRGKTTKEIGRMLNLSFRTIEDRVEQLKIKFGCVSKSQLVEIAINEGYINIISEGIIAKLLSRR